MGKKKSSSIRIGRVSLYQHGRSWYLNYQEQGRRRRVRAGPVYEAARQLAAQVNAQVETGAPIATSFEPLPIPELRKRWLDQHEFVLRSSLATITRYGNATQYLMKFLTRSGKPQQLASEFRVQDAEAFVQFLRSVKVAGSGPDGRRRRPMMDAGIVYVLNTCRSMFHYALKRRHLGPYAPNPFTELAIGRIPIEQRRAMMLLSPQQEVDVINACDEWEFEIIAVLMLTGMRPGEIRHLLVEDVDLLGGWICIRNKNELGWQIKTRTERAIPLLPVVRLLMQRAIADRCSGVLFRCREAIVGKRGHDTKTMLERMRKFERTAGGNRRNRLNFAKRVWLEAGAIDLDTVRHILARIQKQLGYAEPLMPKSLRHGFATAMQDANIDPIVRNRLMGHVTASSKGSHGLGMTAVYTHTRPETLQRGYEAATVARPVVATILSRLEPPRLLLPAASEI